MVEGRYQEIPPDSAGHLPSEQLGIHEGKLRWLTAEGQLIPLPEEAERQQAEQEYQRAEQERQAKEQLQQQLEQLKTIMRSQGLEPEQL